MTHQENKDLAYFDYMDGMKYKDIATKYNVSMSTVKSWKTRYKWDRKSTHTKKEKVRVQKTNKTNKINFINEEAKEISANKELTDKQKLFCVHYIKCFNAKKAAIKAGYSKETSGEQGYQLLQKTSIKNEIEKLKQNKFNRAMLLEDDIFQKYIDIAFADITDYIEFGSEEAQGQDGPYIRNYINIKNSDEIDGTLINEISQGRDGIKVKLQDKMKALQWISDRMDLMPTHVKAKFELEIMRFEMDVIKNTGDSDEIEDDGFIEALDNSAKEVWNDYTE